MQGVVNNMKQKVHAVVSKVVIWSTKLLVWMLEAFAAVGQKAYRQFPIIKSGKIVPANITVWSLAFFIGLPVFLSFSNSSNTQTVKPKIKQVDQANYDECVMRRGTIDSLANTVRNNGIDSLKNSLSHKYNNTTLGVISELGGWSSWKENCSKFGWTSTEDNYRYVLNALDPERSSRPKKKRRRYFSEGC